MMLEPDAWFSFGLASQLLEVQNPEILLGNLILQCSNKVKARQFTLLSSVNGASPRIFQNNLVTASGLAKDTQEPQKKHE